MVRKLTNSEATAVMLAANLKPLEPYRGSGVPWKCICLVCKSECKPAFGSIRQGRSGCPTCMREKIGASRRLDPKTTFDLMIKKGYKPLEPYKASKSRWKCECLLCHRIVAPSYWSVRNSQSKKRGCAFCVGTRVDPKEVRIIMIQNGLKPLEPYPGKDKPWKCKCLTCGNIVSPAWNNIRNGAGGCGNCRYVKSGKSNRTPEKEAIAFMLKAGLQPLEPYLNKEMPWKCKCLDCQNIVYPSAGNIKRGQGGCSYCRETGLNYKEPSYIYLIYHKDFQSIKVGVSNIDSRPNRLHAHKKQGWSIYKTKDFATGEHAEKVETAVLRWLRKDLNLNRHLTLGHMPQGGHSETVDSSEIDLPTIWAKIEEQSRKN